MTIGEIAAKIVFAGLQLSFMLALAPLAQGIIKKVKARCQNRRGPALLQQYYDLLKYFPKTEIVSEHTSWIAAVTPYLTFGCMAAASVLLPIVGAAPLDFAADLIFFIYLFGLARAFTVLAGLDAGSAFGGMGSSREMMIAVLVEPGLMLVLFAGALRTGTTNLSEMIARLASNGLSVLTPSHLLAAMGLVFLVIILKELENWDWSSEGITVKAHLTPSKWRLFLNEDLPTVCLLEILGSRWQRIFEEFFQQAHSARYQQLRKAITGLPPTDRVEQTLRLGRASFGLKPSVLTETDIWADSDQVRETDLWDDPESIEEKAKLKTSLEDLLNRWAGSNSILGRRAALKKEYRDLSRLNSYGRGEGPNDSSAMERAMMQINAELRLAQAAFPGQPVYILKADLKDYYPTLPHELLLEILARFGLKPEQLEFFRRYLQVNMKEGANTLLAQRGVPNHRRFADLLGELVLLLLDYYLRREAKVIVIRMIDDICLIAPSETEAVKAWEALEKFCQALGLVLNRDKCGAVQVGETGPLPPHLPNKPPTWSMVTLNSRGEWSVDAARFEEYLEQSRQQVAGANSLITKVEIFNNCLNYLIRALAMRLRLDDNHRQSVGQAIMRFQNDFFEAGQGMVSELRRLIEERFLNAGSSTPAQLPDAWLHWPITAGGLSLYHPLVLAMSYTEKYNHLSPIQPPEERPPDWQRRRNSWYLYYSNLLEQVEPAGPETNQVMETLVKDFIQRGAEISLGGQHGLSDYWRWVLYIYGPQILDRLGTFRFLITELVPAQLITQKYRQGFTEDDDGETLDSIPVDDIDF